MFLFMIPGIGVSGKNRLKMKKSLLFVLLGIVSIMPAGCEKAIEEPCGPQPEFPALPDPEDVCSAMEDPFFRDYCYRKFDTDNDGKVSAEEADAVTEIDFSFYQHSGWIVSLDGIEYFPNLESLVCSQSRIVSVDISKNRKLRSLGDLSFLYDVYLQNILLPDGLTQIGKEAFMYCASLAEIAIPDGVTQIGEAAFKCCHSLTKFVIPNGVTQIAEEVFLNCSSLTEIIIPDGVTQIGKEAFMGCTSLVEIAIPDGVTQIAERVFWGCSSLTEIIIPDGVTQIGAWAFSGCSALTEIVIPDNVRSIEMYAFYDCFGLRRVVLPEKCSFIAVEEVFEECSDSLCVVCKTTVPPNAGEVRMPGRFDVLYVPAGSVEAYKSSNWGKIFRKIEPIE